MLSLQWCLDGTSYYVAHFNCEASWVRVDKLCPFKIAVAGELIDVPTFIFYIALNLGITMPFCCFLVNLLLLATFLLLAFLLGKIIVKRLWGGTSVHTELGTS